MKRSIFLPLLLLAAVTVQAESIKLKNGTIINGSIVEQTEFSIIVSTKQGTFPLSTREIEKIMPDQHRVFLKGGTQLVGVIEDLDEFNLKLRTQDGLVNVDMPQIVSIEVYDYDQGDAGTKVIEQKVEQVQAAQAAMTQAPATPVAAAIAAAAPAVTPSAPAAGGLSFDSDIAKVFDAKKPQIVQGNVVTGNLVEEGQTMVAAPRALTDEEAFLQGKPAANGLKTHEAIVLPDTQKTLEKAQTKKPKISEKPKFNEPGTNKYFALEVGAISQKITLNNTARLGQEKEDVGGTGVMVDGKFLWRVKNSNLWAGPHFSIATIPNASFYDNDPNIDIANNEALARGDTIPYPDHNASTSGQALAIGASANYYLTPKSLFMFYVTGSMEYRMMTLDYRGQIQGESIKSNGAAFGLGAGVEMRVDDFILGVEAKQNFYTYSGDLKDSDSLAPSIVAKMAWKF